MADFAKLHVWRKAHALMLNVHRTCAGIRGARYAGLRSQMFRAAMSIPTNIVEGRGQKSDKDFARFLGYALNSTAELKYHLIIARDIRAIPLEDFNSLMAQAIEVEKMLHGFIRSLTPTAPVTSTRRVTSRRRNA
jgi:four helix bundle protein